MAFYQGGFSRKSATRSFREVSPEDGLAPFDVLAVDGEFQGVAIDAFGQTDAYEQLASRDERDFESPLLIDGQLDDAQSGAGDRLRFRPDEESRAARYYALGLEYLALQRADRHQVHDLVPFLHPDMTVRPVSTRGKKWLIRSCPLMECLGEVAAPGSPRPLQGDIEVFRAHQFRMSGNCRKSRREVDSPLLELH